MRRLFGVISLLLGTSILLYFVYDHLAERPDDYEKANPGALVTSALMIYVGIAWVRNKTAK